MRYIRTNKAFTPLEKTSHANFWSSVSKSGGGIKSRKFRRLRSLTGFTLVEAMFAIALMVIFGAAAEKLYIGGQRYFKAGLSHLDVQRASKYAIEKIGRRLRNAKSITLLSVDGNNLEFAWEDAVNWTPENNADDRESGLYFTNGDGNNATIEDNQILYDSDVDNGANALEVLVSNLSPTNGEPIFETVTATPNAIRFQFTVFDNYAPDGYQGIDINSVVELRNYTTPYP